MLHRSCEGEAGPWNIRLKRQLHVKWSRRGRHELLPGGPPLGADDMLRMGDLEVVARYVLQWKLMPLPLLLEEHSLARDRPSQGPAR